MIKDTQAIFSRMMESKTAKSKAVRKVESVRRLKTEAEGVEEFEGSLLKAQASAETEVMDDVIDNIQVVTDPEKTVDELEVRADEVQDAIDGTPEGEEAFSDEYVGDQIYACPICGENFFADADFDQEGPCPICQAENTDGFLLMGVVAPVEEEVVNEEPIEDVPVDGEEAEDEELPEGFDDIEEPAEEPEKIESFRRRAKRESKATSFARNKLTTELNDRGYTLLDKVPTEDGSYTLKVEDDMHNKFNVPVNCNGGKCMILDNQIRPVKEAKAVKKECAGIEIEPADDGLSIEVTLPAEDGTHVVTITDEIEEPECINCELDEASFEENLNQFAADNYSGTIDNIDVESAAYVAEDDEICLDCVAECKNGKKIPLQFRMKESRNKGNRSVLIAREHKNAFKTESKRPAFAFQVVNEKGTLRCESLKYSFETKHSTAGKVKVEGYCRSTEKKIRNA